MSLAAIVFSALLSVNQPGRVRLAGIELPPLCGSRALFDVECPGCGLTRAFVSLAHADLARAMEFNRAGVVLAAVVVLQVPYRIAALRHPLGLPLGARVPRWIGWSLIVVLIGNWLAKQVGY